MKETHELLGVASAPDQALSTDLYEGRVLPDGRVLLYWPGHGGGTLYPSRAAAEEMKRRYDETKRRTIEQFRTGFPDPCRELLPPVADFLRDVEAHAKSLGPRLKIPADVLDGTPESLDAVDRALKKIPWAKRQVPDLVTPLVAYLGEVIRMATGGQWSTSTARGHENEPMITTRGGNLVQPFASVFIPMIEPSKRMPLRSAVPTHRPLKAS